MLDEVTAAEQLGERRPFIEWCGLQVTMYDWLGSQHVGINGWFH
jgi:hypothetical protein